MRLNTEQCGHVASVLHTLAAGQLAAFGYVALNSRNWTLAFVSCVIFLMLQMGAAWVLTTPKEDHNV